MPLARAWWRGSAWALAATLVVPGALAIAVATIALGGGLRSLGAVAQIVTGPAVPEAQLSDQPVRTTNTARPTRLPSVPRSAAAGATTTQALRVATGRGGAPTTTRRTTPSGSSTPAPVTRRPATGTAPSRPSNAPANQPPASGGNDDALRQTGKAVAGTAGSAVPAPAGPAAADAVTTVLDLVDPPKAGPTPAVTAP